MSYSLYSLVLLKKYALYVVKDCETTEKKIKITCNFTTRGKTVKMFRCLLPD